MVLGDVPAGRDGEGTPSACRTGDLEHAGDLVEAVHERGKLLAVPHADLQTEDGELVLGAAGVDAQHEGVGGGEGGGDVQQQALPVVHNVCPADKHTKRQEVKELLASLQAQYPDVKTKIFGAMQRLPLPEWGPVENRRRPLPEELGE